MNELRDVARAGLAVFYPAGSTVVRQQDEGDSMFAVIQGTVQMETELLIKSVRVNTLSKLTFADAIGFLGLIKDVFPGCSSEDIRYAKLELAIKEVMTSKPYNLKFDEGQVRKMIQLKRHILYIWERKILILRVPTFLQMSKKS